MITKFQLFEDFQSGVVRCIVNNKPLVFKLKVNNTEKGTKVYLMLDDQLYDELSILVPDTNKLTSGEFFLNPDINPDIVKELESQNFIQKSGKNSKAGDKNTISYSLTI